MMPLAACLLSLSLASTAQAADTAVPHAANAVEAYRVRFWGTERSQQMKATFHVLTVDNDALELRHCIRPGRWGNYVLPYWPITGSLSIIDRPAELALLGGVDFTVDGEQQHTGLVVHEGFELARVGDADVVRVTNRGVDTPVLMEFIHVIPGGQREVQVLVRVTNRGDDPLADVTAAAIYRQSFNWSDFRIAGAGAYRAVEAPRSGQSRCFAAYSEGMDRGFELLAGEGCALSYDLSVEMNRWEVRPGTPPTDLAPGESMHFSYVVRTIHGLPNEPPEVDLISDEELLGLDFRSVRPAAYKTSPVETRGRVMLRDVLRNAAGHKTRGLNLRAGFPQALDDLETLKEWGCNLVITGIGNPEHTRELVERGHELGMEMFLQGSGRYTEGAPGFDSYYGEPLPPEQHADAHGQDEDHTYWYAIEPTRDFAADFGKPMAVATQEEKVLYWSRCFLDKWRGVLADVHRWAPEGDIWFYMPAPWPAHLDPLDYNDVFFRQVSALGDRLTVFPFYYGVDFDNCQYMMRRWKDAGAARAVFLPMRGFMERPGQFVRAITAARRGGADGTCGFAFPVGAEERGREWEWKSVMLGAWANFPTADLDAWCLIEEPAELLEALATAEEVALVGEAATAETQRRLAELLPGEVTRSDSASTSDPGRLTVLTGREALSEDARRLLDAAPDDARAGKGVLWMQGRTVGVWGPEATAVQSALGLLERFAELAEAERQALQAAAAEG